MHSISVRGESMASLFMVLYLKDMVNISFSLSSFKRALIYANIFGCLIAQAVTKI